MAGHSLRREVTAGAAATVALVVIATTLGAHDLFLRLEQYFVPANAEVRVHVLNGTFSRSEGAVTRDRLRALDLECLSKPAFGNRVASPHEGVSE